MSEIFQFLRPSLCLAIDVPLQSSNRCTLAGADPVVYAPFKFVDPATVTHAYASLDGSSVSVLEPHEDFRRALCRESGR
ncbi:hypothetical protein [Rhodococcus sp. HNM0569]|uniref:hypothetical protein n=1 Tax=Rhodococcus sp. HNM0569 TaxID=2716340 RepID=UPI00146A13BF|nr:hypothetical protein [Rhodococcus sp. HNM0569]